MPHIFHVCLLLPAHACSQLGFYLLAWFRSNVLFKLFFAGTVLVLILIHVDLQLLSSYAF